MKESIVDTGKEKELSVSKMSINNHILCTMLEV